MQYLQKLTQNSLNMVSTSEVGREIEARKLFLAAIQENHPRKRKRLFRKAANMGHRKSMYELGKCYENGIGTHQQLDKAIQWFKEAQCYYNLGLFVEKNWKEISKKHIHSSMDTKKAIPFYKRAVRLRVVDALGEQQKIKAAFRLGILTLKEKHTEQSLKAARDYFIIANSTENIAKVNELLSKYYEKNSDSGPVNIQSEDRNQAYEEPSRRDVTTSPNSSQGEKIMDLLSFDFDNSPQESRSSTNLQETIDLIFEMNSNQIWNEMPNQSNHSVNNFEGFEQIFTASPVSHDKATNSESQISKVNPSGFTLNSSINNIVKLTDYNAESVQKNTHVNDEKKDHLNDLKMNQDTVPSSEDTSGYTSLQMAMVNLTYSLSNVTQESIQYSENFATLTETLEDSEIIHAITHNNSQLLRKLLDSFLDAFYQNTVESSVVIKIINSIVLFIQLNKAVVKVILKAEKICYLCFDLLSEGIFDEDEEKQMLALILIFELYGSEYVDETQISESQQSTIQLILSLLQEHFSTISVPLGIICIISLAPCISTFPTQLTWSNVLGEAFLNSFNEHISYAHVRFHRKLNLEAWKRMFSKNDIMVMSTICEREIRDRDDNDKLRCHLLALLQENDDLLLKL